MNTSPIGPSPVAPNSQPRRLLAALLCAFGAAAFVVAVLAGSALAAGTNLLLNSSFEKDSDGDGIPNNWIDFGTGITPKRVCNQSVAGSCSLKFVLDDNDKGVYQNLSISGDAGDAYKLTFWMKGKLVEIGTGNLFVSINFIPAGGATGFLPVGTSAWSKHALIATASADYTDMAVQLESNALSGKVWFDRFKIVPYVP